MKNRNLFILIFFLTLIVTLLVVWNFLLKPAKVVKVEPTPEAQPEVQKEVPHFPSPLLSPSPIFSPSQPSPTPEKKPGVKKTKNKIIDNLPYETDSYSIQYLPNTDKFFILIKQNPYEQYKNQAIAWFRGLGVANPEEELPLFFTSTRWVAPE